MKRLTLLCLLTALPLVTGCKPDAAVERGAIVGAGPTEKGAVKGAQPADSNSQTQAPRPEKVQ